MIKLLSQLLLILLTAMAVDNATKSWAEQNLDFNQPMPIIGQFLRFRLGHNSGMALGLFSNTGILPLIITGLVITGLFIWFIWALYSGEFPPVASWPAGLILGGAISNFVDRLLDSKVTDFLDIGLGTNRWPTFNLADSFILMGLAVLMVITAREKKPLDEHAQEQG